MKEPSSRRRAFDAARDDLAALDLDLEAVIARMMDARPGVPGGQAFGARGGGSELTGPERHARTRHEGDHPANAAIKEFDRALRQLTTAAQVLRRHHRANTPHPASAKQRAEVERVNAGETMCEHCTPWAHRLGLEQVYRTGTVSGNLPAPMALGRWCYDFVMATGSLPTKAQVERHDDGERVYRSAS